jgi:hypothetical protein
MFYPPNCTKLGRWNLLTIRKSVKQKIPHINMKGIPNTINSCWLTWSSLTLILVNVTPSRKYFCILNIGLKNYIYIGKTSYFKTTDCTLPVHMCNLQTSFRCSFNKKALALCRENRHIKQREITEPTFS